MIFFLVLVLVLASFCAAFGVDVYRHQCLLENRSNYLYHHLTHLQRTLYHHPWPRPHCHDAQLLARRRHKGKRHALNLVAADFWEHNVSDTLVKVSASSTGHRSDWWGAYPRPWGPGQLWDGHSCREAGALHSLRWGSATAVSPCATGCWHRQPGEHDLRAIRFYELA